MSADRVRPSRVRAEQDRALARYVAHEVYAYSEVFRDRLDACGLGRRGVRRQEDLARLPPITLAEVDAAALVLRPARDSVIRHGGRQRALEMRWAGLTGATERLARFTIEPHYKPVRWTLADGMAIGSSAADVERLADLGRRLLELAGLRTTDVLVGVATQPDNLALWQLAMGARNGGVPSLFIGEAGTGPGNDPDAVARLHPTVLAGPPEAVSELLRELAIARLHLPELHTIITTGALLDPTTRAEIAALAAEAHGHGRAGVWPAADPAVVAAWAPPGARALWGECRGGDWFHTWPTSEVVQAAGREAELVTAEGDLLWSAVGWRGSVLLRLAIGMQGTVALGPCPTCGRTTPRVRVAAFG